jgi:Vault protein inter-alpha-trypsin domain
VVLGEKRVIGIIKEKEEAKKEFQEKVQQGYTMVYSEKDDK